MTGLFVQMVPAPLAHLPSPPHRLLLCHLSSFLHCGDQDEETPGRHSCPRIFLHYLLLVQGLQIVIIFIRTIFLRANDDKF